MDRKTFSLLLGMYYVLCAILSPPPIFAQNLITNPSFESNLDNWDSNNAQSVTPGHDGDKAAQINNDSSNSRGISQKITGIHPGDYFRLSFWVKGLSDNLSKTFARIAWYEDGDSSQMSKNDSANSSGNFEWKQVTTEFVVPEKAASLELRLYIASSTDATASAIFDNIQLETFVPSPTPTPTITPTPTNTPTPTLTQAPTNSPTPTDTKTPTPTKTTAPSKTPTSTKTPTPTNIDIAEIPTNSITDDDDLEASTPAVLGVADIPTLAPTPRLPSNTPTPTSVSTSNEISGLVGRIPPSSLAIGMIMLGLGFIAIPAWKLAKNLKNNNDWEV